MAKIIPPNRKRNVLWPVKRRGKGLVTGILAERYASALNNLLITPLGSLVTAPTYGSRMNILRTQSLSEGQISVEQRLLRNSIAEWIPDIVITEFKFTGHPETEVLEIDIAWGIPDATSASGDPAQRFAFGPVNTTITI
jgi:phage baseplate assembly protein W